MTEPADRREEPTAKDAPGALHAPDDASRPGEAHGSLREIALLFLRLGFTAFGGPVAHIAMMRQEFVQRRRWISDQHFADLFGIVNLIPGPSSTELAIYLGYLRAGWAGLLLAGVCFIGPAMLIVLALAWAYVTFGKLPQVGWLLYGILPVVIAIVVRALWGLGRTVLRNAFAIIWGVALLAAYLLTGNALLVLFGGGILYAAIIAGWHALHKRNGVRSLFVPLLPGGAATSAASLVTTVNAATVVSAPFSLLTLFVTFLKIGAVLYGSGYVLLAFLRADFVQGLGWLTDRQLLDAVAVGQFTPGPVFTTATFIGYLVGGLPGALLATLAIFLPSFAFIPIIHRLSGWMRRTPMVATALVGVNVAALALMAGVTLQLAQTALRDLLTWALALAVVLILPRFRFNSAWLILLGGLIGILAHLLPL